MATIREQLAEHLRAYAEFGVDGFSREPSWRARVEPRHAVPADTDAAAAGPGELSENTRSVVVDANAGASLAAIEEARQETPAAAPPGEALEALRCEIGDCTRCKLSRLGRTQVVFGVGSPSADLMFVGEGPGFDEDQQGIPFVGRAGQLLTKMIEAIDLRRDEVYIANVVKCRPPGNRNPEPDEIATCEPFLFRQIEIVRPKVIVALGKFAAQTLLRSTAPISKLRGREYPFHGATLVPTFHPAFLLRSPAYKREAWDDLKRVRAMLADARAARA